MTVHYPRCLVVLHPLWDDFRTLDVRPEDRLGRMVVVPVSAEWTGRTLGDADEATVTFDWHDLPLDARVLRDARVTIVAADVRDPRVQLRADDETARRFVGLADEVQSEFGDTGGTVTVRARDLSGRLRITPWPAKRTVRLDQPLTAVVQAVLTASGVPGYGSVPVDAATDDAGRPFDPVVSRITGRTRWTPAEKASCWDAVEAVCRLAAIVPGFVLDRLVLRQPGPPRDPAVRLVWGENLQSLSYTRSLDPVERKAVRLRAYDTRSRRVLEVRYPASSTDDDERPVIGFVLPSGTWDQDRLHALAKAYYLSLGESELRGSASTVVMRDVQDTDLLGLRGGDVLSIRVRTEREITVQGMSHGEVVDYLRARGIDARVADGLARAWLDAERLATVFSVARATHHWTRDRGYDLRVDFQGFVAPRRT